MRVCNDYCDLLTPTPWCPGWGLVYQAGEPDDRIYLIPGPLVVMSFNHDRDNAQWIRHPQIVANLTVGIPDNAQGVLPDSQLIALVETGKDYLSRGVNLLVHCAAGQSRSSYYSCALTMRVLDVGFDEALARVKAQRPQANPNSAFVAHLRSLEGRLRRRQV